MAIKCRARECRFNNGGWCDSEYVEIDEKRTCEYFEEDKP